MLISAFSIAKNDISESPPGNLCFALVNSAKNKSLYFQVRSYPHYFSFLHYFFLWPKKCNISSNHNTFSFISLLHRFYQFILHGYTLISIMYSSCIKFKCIFSLFLSQTNLCCIPMHTRIIAMLSIVTVFAGTYVCMVIMVRWWESREKFARMNIENCWKMKKITRKWSMYNSRVILKCLYIRK